MVHFTNAEEEQGQNSVFCVMHLKHKNHNKAKVA